MTKSDILNNYVFKSLDESAAMCVELTEEPIPGFKITESGKRRCGRAILVTKICSKWEVKKALEKFKFRNGTTISGRIGYYDYSHVVWIKL